MSGAGKLEDQPTLMRKRKAQRGNPKNDRRRPATQRLRATFAEGPDVGTILFMESSSIAARCMNRPPSPIPIGDGDGPEVGKRPQMTETPEIAVFGLRVIGRT